VSRVRDELDVATNDVLLALTTWGFRRMLLDAGRTPPDTLRALVPLAPATGDRFTNEVSSLVANLPVGVNSISLAVQLINDQTRNLAGTKAVAGANLSDLSGLHAPTLCALGLRSASAAGVRMSDIHTVVVNAPGPREPVTLLGRQLVGLYPAIPLVSRARITVGVMSHGDRFGFGITADRENELDIEQRARGINDAVELVSHGRADRDQSLPG
jgi:diacylglycerol O-acyltransferase